MKIKTTSSTTLASLAYKYYGSSLRYRSIIEANPEIKNLVFEPFPIGIDLRIPDLRILPGATISFPVNLAEANGEMIEAGKIVQLDSQVSSSQDIILPQSFL